MLAVFVRVCCSTRWTQSSGLMRNASTRTGLKTTVNIIRRIYETGRQVSEDFKASMPILFDDRLPKWNYRAVPH